MKQFIFAIALFYNLLALSYAQGIVPPSEGKSVVYFVRVSGLGFAINFSYFDNDKFIGKFNGPNYMRYECEPGEHLFWARSENKDFITADLEAGKIYFIEAVPQMGFIKAGVQLVPINPKDDNKRTEKIEKLINKRTPQSMSESDLEKQGKDLQEVITKALEKYKEDVAGGKKIDRLEKNMFYEKPANTADK